MTGITLLLADVDGTLVTQEKELTKAAIAAADDLRRAGVRLAITSGRPPRGMRMLIEPLKLEGVIAGFNGGVVVNPDMSVVSSLELDKDVAALAVRTITQGGLDVWVYTPDEWLLLDPNAPHVDREAKTVGFGPRVVEKFTDEHMAHCVKVVGVSDDHDKVEQCEETTQKALGDGASATRSQPYYLDVTHPEATKGHVVMMLSKLFDIPTERIATIGDMPNDVLMFKKSGLSIAMGNSSDQVKKQAIETTDGNDAEGFAHAVEKFVLPRAAKPA